MVMFCRKKPGQFSFRDPIESDFLGSQTRRMVLKPRYEVDIGPYEQIPSSDVLRRGKTSALAKWHSSSAIGHWNVMRTVLPASVWENW